MSSMNEVLTFITFGIWEAKSLFCSNDGNTHDNGNANTIGNTDGNAMWNINETGAAITFEYGEYIFILYSTDGNACGSYTHYHNQ